MKYDVGQASLDMIWYNVCYGIISLKSDSIVLVLKKNTLTRKVR